MFQNLSLETGEKVSLAIAVLLGAGAVAGIIIWIIASVQQGGIIF